MGSNGSGPDIWANTPLGQVPVPKVDLALGRMLARDATMLERDALELRQIATTASPEAAVKAVARADGLDRQAARIWSRVDEILDGK